jgi:hypothetical protein
VRSASKPLLAAPGHAYNLLAPGDFWTGATGEFSTGEGGEISTDENWGIFNRH